MISDFAIYTLPIWYTSHYTFTYSPVARIIYVLYLLMIFYFCVQVSLHAKADIQGMTISDKKLYVIFTNVSNIDVYDTDGLHFLQRLPVEQIVSPFDIVATDNILFVSEFQSERIRRIELHGKIVNTLVVTDSNPQGITLSVTEKGNVIASVDMPSKLVEYTSTGGCVRTIVLGESLEGLRHSIQLNNDLFLVCHSSSTLDRVCLINRKVVWSRVLETTRDRSWGISMFPNTWWQTRTGWFTWLTNRTTGSSGWTPLWISSENLTKVRQDSLHRSGCLSIVIESGCMWESTLTACFEL